VTERADAPKRTETPIPGAVARTSAASVMSEPIPKDGRREAWPRLPEVIRKAMLALAESGQ